MGRIEARPLLKSLLRKAPTEDVIDAVSSVADEECIVLLGRVARALPRLVELAQLEQNRQSDLGKSMP
jgi:hypothetical protein